MNIKELKEAIKDLPDDMSVVIEGSIRSLQIHVISAFMGTDENDKDIFKNVAYITIKD